jgi:maleylpyruvate isomerase
MKIYGYWRSSCTYRVRIALGLKKRVFEVVAVNLVEDGGEQHKDGYRALNPMSQVPLLEVEHDGKVARLSQSMAILEYLEETYPEPHILPSDPIERARARQLAEIVNSGIQPLQNLAVTQRLKELEVDSDAWCAAHIRRGLSAYQAVCAVHTLGRFSVGDRPSIADCLLVPQLYNARRFKIDIQAEFPILARIDTECAKLEAFENAHPDRQPDRPR